MRKNLLILLTLFWTAAGAQKVDFDNYKTIKSSGSLPKDVIKSASEKFEESKSQISKKDKYTTRKDKEEFLLSSSFAIDDILLSGSVLYNDPISEYCQKVLDEVLKNEDGKYKDNLKLHIIKSDVVNAYSTAQGYIFITTALIAQLSTEAELAFVLSHEVIHFKKKHAIKSYVENKKIARGEGAYKTSDVDERIDAIISHSKENELEADELGFEIYKDTKYSFEAINGTFDVLMYSYLPFDDIEYDTNFLGNRYMRFPRNYFLDQVQEIDADEDYDDEISTHPNIASRREAMEEMIVKEPAEGRKDFIISKEEFLQVRKICRFETCRLSMMDQHYVKAIYEAYCLMKEEPNSRYLKKIVAKSLYGLTAYADKKKYKAVLPKWERVQGNAQQIAHFFSKLSATELNVLAVEYAWKTRAQYPDDEELIAVSDELMRYLVKYHFDSKKFFSDSAAAAMNVTYEGAENERVKLEKKEKKEKKKKSEKKKKEEADEEEDDSDTGKDKDSASKGDEEDEEKPAKKESTKSDKYKKIKSKKKSRRDYLKYAYVDLLKDTAFTACFDKYIKLKKKEMKGKEDAEAEAEKKESADKLYRKYGYALGINKVLVVNPLYYKVDEAGSGDGIDLLASEAAQKQLNDQILACAGKLNLKCEIVDNKNLKSDDAEKLNDMGTVDAWLGERIDNAGYLNISTELYDIQDIINKYDTRYLCVMGVFGVRETVDGTKATTNAFCCMGGVPGLVHYCSNVLFNKNKTYMFINVYDLETGKKEMVKLYEIPFKDRSPNVSAIIYDALYQVKSDGKGVHIADNEDEYSMLNEKDKKKKEKKQEKNTKKKGSKKTEEETEDED